METDRDLVQFYNSLTPRKREVLQWALQGWSNSEIAARLVIQPCVVMEHLSDIYGDLGTLDRFADRHPNRVRVMAVFAGFFERHPDLAVR